ncbi:MAG TPA: glycosyltransferase family 2 protein [Rhizomicrobium sp.]|nr:glycosyltransferase family 2 protein [Rhizomicrobium sp.]
MSPPTLADYDSYATKRDALPREAAPLVSIVTVCLNAAHSLERTIASVQAQTFASIEHVFVDGGSTDASLDIIRRMARPQDFWISEKDRGISDAFNKGVALARGRFVLILNADDWLSPDQIERSVTALKDAAADFVFGDLIFYENDRPVFRYQGDPNYAKVIHRRWPSVGHPTLLAARDCFARVGLFDPIYRNAMDYDWLLRLHGSGGRGVYCSGVVGHMTHDGVSNLQFGRTVEEVRRIVVAAGRNRLVAVLEAKFRRLKTGLAQPLKRRGRPLYQLVRRTINRSFRPLSA